MAQGACAVGVAFHKVPQLVQGLALVLSPFLMADVYEWICGVIYGEQTGASDWKRALAYIFTAKMGFYEVRNMESEGNVQSRWRNE